MSNISLNINIDFSAETAQTRAPNEKGRKRKRSEKKRRQMEKNDSVEGKRKKRHRRRKSHAHQSGVSKEGSVFAAPFPKLVCPSSTDNRYECLASTQNNNLLPSSSSKSSSSKPPTSTQNSISSAPPSSTASAPEPSASGQNQIPSPSSSSSSFKPSTSKQDKGLPQPSRAAAAPNCSHTPSASTHSLPSSNSRGPCDSQEELWSTALAAAAASPASSVTSSHKQATAKTATAAGIPTKYLAIDCEMVGTGPKGSISQLARCSVVNYEGDVVYDKFINPSVPVTDYRTRWSGIRRCDLINATPYAVARKEILKLLMGKVVIGHAIHNDFKVLSYSHPAAMTRDTARIPLLNQRAGFEGNQSASLKRLTKAIFNRDIQTGRKGHSSVEDAKATMELYKVVEEEWERTLASRTSSGPV